MLQWEKYDFLFYITDFPSWGFGVDDKNVKLPFILFNPSLIVFSEEESVPLWSSLKGAAINIILFKMMPRSSRNYFMNNSYIYIDEKYNRHILIKSVMYVLINHFNHPFVCQI